MSIDKTYKNQNVNFYGIDPAKGMLEIANNKIKDKRIKFKEGSFEKIPLKNNSVDKIISTLALHWVTSIDKGLKGAAFSKGLYDWIMFVLSFYVRVRENLNIDFESFVILQVVVSHSLYEINKSGPKTFIELGEQMVKLRQKKTRSHTRLTFASISDVLSLPRETVRRKVLNLCKQNILSSEGIL